jgi:hypothetical protein
MATRGWRCRRGRRRRRAQRGAHHRCARYSTALRASAAGQASGTFPCLPRHYAGYRAEILAPMYRPAALTPIPCPAGDIRRRTAASADYRVLQQPLPATTDHPSSRGTRGPPQHRARAARCRGRSRARRPCSAAGPAAHCARPARRRPCTPDERPRLSNPPLRRAVARPYVACPFARPSCRTHPA